MRNSLFSDYYLAELFPSDTAVEAARGRVPALRGGLEQLWSRVGQAVEGASEADLEDRLIRPVLRLLGFEYLIQTPLRPANRVPDYLLFATAHDAARAAANRADAVAHALGLAEAKRWDMSLDRGTRGGTFEDRNPSLQVDEYLRAANLEWAILTNGRHWRLYNRASSYRLDAFFEIDLIEALGSDEDLTAFAALFSRAAFPGPAGNGLLERAMSQSIDHAQTVGSSLQSSVYEALRLLCEGLLRAGTRQGVQASLPAVRDAAFVLIFRLLFVLYAEAREYLPVNDRAYALSFSLRTLAHELADMEAHLDELAPGSTTYWSRLRSLFNLIADGSPDAPRVTSYDGGLFDRGRHPMLEELEPGDPWIAQAINRLTRADLPHGRGFVSYRDLGVRELGTIYEALLEQHPFIAQEETFLVRRRGALVYARAAETRGRVFARYPTGSVLLQTDRGERRETGTYYTPGPVVRYMTSAAISAALEARREGVDPVQAVLGLRVLDPAMGSGHFLVEAVDVLARELVAALSGTTPGDEAEIRWARREVVERCIYGVDVNPLAVELAKLSLWLVTIQSGKPLSFLDHHLRHGNSVVYYPISTAIQGRHVRPMDETLWAQEDAGQTAVQQLVSAMQSIADRPTDTLDDVHAKRQAFADALDGEAAVRRYLNLCTAAVFDRSLQRAVQAAFLILYQGGQWRTPAIDGALASAEAMANDRHFFHWEAEFPEVFAGGQAGFDVVLSNPPYVSAWTMQETDPVLRRVIPALPQFQETAVRHWDLFVPFATLALGLLAPAGVMALILPNPADRELYAENLRAWVLANADMLSLVDFGSANVFEDVSRQNVIWVCRRRSQALLVEDDHQITQIVDPDSIAQEPTLPTTASTVPQAAWRVAPHSHITANLTPEEARIIGRLTMSGLSLHAVLHVSYGAQIGGTGDAAFARTRYLASEPSGMRSPKRFLEGRQLRPYSAMWAGQWLDYRPDEFYGPRSSDLFESPKLVVRKISGNAHTLIALADFEGYYLDDGAILGIRRVPGVGRPELLAIAGCLNSAVANLYYRSVFATDSLQGEFSHVYPIAVKSARLPSFPVVPELLPTGHIHDGQGWMTGFDSPAHRAATWATIAASLSGRLHEIAAALWEQSRLLSEFVHHRVGVWLSEGAIEELAAGALDVQALVDRCSTALGRALAGEDYGSISAEARAVLGRLEGLRREASLLDGLIDVAIEDAFALSLEDRDWVHTRLAGVGAAGGSRMWPKSWAGD